MTLQKQTIDIPLAGGLETKLDARIMQPGSVLSLENAEFDKFGAINKRNGYTALTKATSTGSNLAAGVGLYRRKDELVMLDGQSLYSYTPNASRWEQRGDLPTLACKSWAISGAGSSSMFCPAFAINSNIQVAAWSDGTSVYATAIDATTGAVIVAPTILTSSGLSTAHVETVSSGAYVYVVAGDSFNSLNLYYLDTASPTSFTSFGALRNDYRNGRIVLVATTSADAACFYQKTTGDLTAFTFNHSGVVVAATSCGVTLLSASICMAAVRNSSTGDLYVMAHRSDNNVVTLARKSDLTSKFGVAVVGSYASASFGTGYFSTNAYFHFNDGSSHTRYFAVDSTGTLTVTDTIFARTVVPAGKWIEASTGKFLPTSAIGTDATVPGMYLLDDSGQVSAAVRRNFTLSASGCSFIASSTDVYRGLVINKKLSTVTSSIYVPEVVEFDFTHTPIAAELGENLHLTGGVLWEYDGINVVENGFLQRPVLTLTGLTAGGSLADGTYQLTALYRWVDASGQIHESGLADTKTVTISGGGGSGKITMTVSTLWLSRKSASVQIIVFATRVNASTFYEFSSTNNDTTADTVTPTAYTANVSTTHLELYTDGGVVENGPPDSLHSIVRKGTRLYGVDYQGRLWFSKGLTIGYGITFADELFTSRLVDDPQGDTFSIATMDGSLFVFGPSTIQGLNGDGPTDTGINSDLSTPQLLSTTVGVDGQVVGAVTDLGYIFKGSSGFVLLDRSGQVNQQFGFPVDTYKNLTVVSAVTLTAKKQIRFGNSDGSFTIYDYAAQKWALHGSLSDHVAAVVFEDLYTRLDSAGQVEQQSAGFTESDGSSIQLLVETPWFRLGLLQGFVRIYNASILGTWKSAHTLTVLVYTDHSETAVATKTFDLSTGYAADQVIDLKIGVGRKCKAVKFQIYDSAQAGTKESLSLISMGLECGGKPGLFRVAAAQRA